MFICGDGQKCNTNKIFGLGGINDKRLVIEQMGIPYLGREVFVADHFRAIADLVIALSELKTAERVIILDDYMSTIEEKMQVINLLSINIAKIPEYYRDKVVSWVERNSPKD